MKQKISAGNFMHAILFIAFFTCLNQKLCAQGISTYQYRQVSAANAEEFVKRETTYWSKVARTAIDKGTLTFWALLEKVDGSDMPNSPNFLFINTYTNIDTGDVWNATATFPNIPISKMETGSISMVTSQFFLQSRCLRFRDCLRCRKLVGFLGFLFRSDYRACDKSLLRGFSTWYLGR